MNETIILPSEICSIRSDKNKFSIRLTDLDIVKRNSLNIHEIYISDIPKELSKMYILIGHMVIYSFSHGELIKAQRLNSNILESISIKDKGAVTVPINDAYYQYTDIEFVFDKECVMKEEIAEIVDEYIDVPHFGKECTIYQGDKDDYKDDLYPSEKLYSGVEVSYTLEKSGNKIREIIKGANIKTPLLRLELKESYLKGNICNYNINFWERIIIDPLSLSWSLDNLIVKYKLTPVYLKNIDEAISKGKPFLAKVMNYIIVQEHMAGKGIYFGP